MNSPLTPTQSGTKPGEMRLLFDASLDTAEGVLAVVQEWAAEQGMTRDDALSLRLVLEELLTNICLHAHLPHHHNKVDMHLQILRTGTPGQEEEHVAGGRPGQAAVRITLRDTGRPFNPLVHTEQPLGDIESTSTGGRGLTLVRLIATRMDYQRTHGGNCLSLTVPMNMAPDEGRKPLPMLARAVPHTLGERLRAVWCSNLALRQTVFFTLCSMVLIWGAVALYSIEIANERRESALMLTRQAMHTQSVISSTFLERVGGSLVSVANDAAEVKDLLSRPDDLVRELQRGAALRSLWAEIPVLGIVVGHGKKNWLYRLHDGELEKQQIDSDLAFLASPGGSQPQWQGLFMNFLPNDQHAAMICALTLAPSGRAEDGWMGTIITMPWIKGTLHALSGFKNAAPFYTDSQGRYVIFPPGRSLGQGPQSLGQEALLHDAPRLEEIEEDMLQGRKNAVQLRPVLGGDLTPWNLPWQGPTTLAYYPMSLKGWHLGLLVSSEELGDAVFPLPRALFFMAVLGPLCIGLITWFVTSRTLRPLHELVNALEGFGSGDLNVPFPRARFADEIGVMLTTFERVRVTLRASFRNLVNSAAAQQRMQNELGLARGIQQSMLPTVFPSLSWVKVDAHIDMCREVCGDLYDCFCPHTRPERLCCVMGDVCGKGVPAAIIMSRTMSLAQSFLQEGHSPSETLEKLNTAQLRSDASSMFVTMLVGILEPDGLFRWASAGHPPPLPGPEPQRSPEPLGLPECGRRFSPGMAAPLPWPGELVLGVRKEQRYSTFTLRLKPGQSVLLYTDGADEAVGPPASPGTPGEIYGEARLAASLDKACRMAHTPKDITAMLRQDLAAHMKECSPADDISLMVLTYRGDEA